MKNMTAQTWAQYRERELAVIVPVLETFGFTLDVEQPHTIGERYLMRGHKLVLTGTYQNKKVIIKTSSDPKGIKEIEEERQARQTLHKLKFSYSTFLSPREVFYKKIHGRVVTATEFIEQPHPFLTRSLKEQFTLALAALKNQEGVHATTSSHAGIIRHIFGVWNTDEYLHRARVFKERIQQNYPRNEHVSSILENAIHVLNHQQTDIERYCGFLTHEDFALHNFRIRGNDIYLIDYAALRFGNKHESWARFLNYMVLYNHPLENALVEYVEKNRSPEEGQSLRLMRIYKLMQLINYYAFAYAESSGDLQKLSEERIEFWTYVLESILNNEQVSDERIASYKKRRDELRSDEEKKRQQELQQLL